MKFNQTASLLLGLYLILFVSMNLQAQEAKYLQLPAYYSMQLELPTRKDPPDTKGIFKKARKYTADLSTGLLRRKLGTHYLTERLVPIAFDKLYEVFVMDKYGDLSLGRKMSIVDGIVNTLIAEEKTTLKAYVGKLTPSLPLVGNVFSGFVDSHKLYLENNSMHYKMNFTNRIAPAYKWGNFSFSGGAKTDLTHKDFSKTPVGSFSYSPGDDNYKVKVLGRKVKFEMSRKYIDAKLEWNHKGVKFEASITF